MKHSFKAQFLLFLSSLLLMSRAAAQNRVVQNKPYIDQRKFHYGFFIGLHDQALKLINNGYIVPGSGEQWMAENDNQSYGFQVGILGDWKLSRLLSIRLQPALYFGSKHIAFRELSTQKEDAQTIKSALISAPVDLKISTFRRDNYRPYFVAGVAPYYDLTPPKNDKIRTNPLTFNLEVGMGCDLYLPFFKLIPELKFSFGFLNMLNKKRNDLTDEKQKIFTKSLDRASMNIISLTLYFE